MATPTRDDDAATHNESETHPPAPAPTGKTPADMILCLYRLPLPLSHTSERTRTSTLTTLFQRGSLSLIQCPPETVCGEELVLAIAGRGTPPPAPATITLNGLPMMMEALQDAARIVRREDEDAGWRNMSVHDNVEFAVRQRSVGGPPRCEDVHRIVGTLFELVGIATAEASVCWEDASIAIRRRVAVVRCLIQCPLMLIMDGAMDGLTEEEAIAFMHVLKRVAQTSHRAILGMMMADSVHEDEDDEDDASSSGHAEALSLRHSRRSHAPPRVLRKMLDEEDEACVALLHNANDATSSRLAQLWKPRRAGTSSDEYDDDDAGLVVVVSVASLPSFVTLVGVVDHLTLLAHYDGRTIFSGPLPTLLRWHMLLHEEAVHDREGDGEPMSCLTSISNASSFGEPPCSISSHPHDVHLRGRRSNRPADVDELLAMLQEEGQCSPPSVSGTEPRTKKKQQRHHLAERTTNRSALMNGRNAAVHLNDAAKDALFSPLNLPCVGELMREPLHVCHVLREELRYGLRSLWSCALNQPSWWGLALILASLMLAALTVCAHKDAYDCATTVKWLTIVLTAASIQLPMFSSSLSISICTNALDAMALRRHQPHGNWRATIGWLGCLILHTTTHVLMGCMMLLPSLAIHVYWNATTGLLAALDDTDMRHTARMDHQLGIMAEAAGSSSLWARKELPMLELTMICVLSSITSSFAMVSVQLAWMWSSAVVGPRWEWWVMEVVAPVVEIILAFVNCIGILVVSFPDKRAVLPSSLTETHIWGIATWLGRQGISAAHTAVLRWQRFGCDEAVLAPSTWSIHIHDGGHVLTNTCLTGHMMLEKMGLGVNDLSTLVAPLLASTYIAMVVCTLTLWCASRYDLVG